MLQEFLGRGTIFGNACHELFASGCSPTSETVKLLKEGVDIKPKEEKLKKANTFDLFAARFLAICTRHTYIDEQLEMESMTNLYRSHRHLHLQHLLMPVAKQDRQAGRQADRQTGRQADR